MLRKLRNDNKGFTLIELMIVIAIIGILAAIAIPQFAAYRARSFNAAALTDVRNGGTNQAGLFADWQIYGGSQVNGAAAVSAGIAMTSPFAPGAEAVFAGTDANGVLRQNLTGVSNSVTLVANTDAIWGTFTCVTAHNQSVFIYGSEADTTKFYYFEDGKLSGVDIGAGDCEAATPDALDFGAPWLQK